jgi:hypothetical protein
MPYSVWCAFGSDLSIGAALELLNFKVFDLKSQFNKSRASPTLKHLGGFGQSSKVTL